MISSIIKRSVVIAGHKTSISLEDEFWRAFKEIAQGCRAPISDLLGEIDEQRTAGNLSSAVRLFVLQHSRAPSLIEPLCPMSSNMGDGDKHVGWPSGY
jgi:predicted DNA-binding ribbon-helix-helix protein